MKYNGGPVFRVRVKICGLTSLGDALAAVEAGADALGFNFYEKSPRYIPLQRAASIIRKLPPLVTVVGVFVNPGLETMRRAIGGCRLDLFQMQGEEKDDFLSLFPSDKIIKAVAVRGRRSLKSLVESRHAGACLLDAWAPGKKGGTGRVFDWELAKLVRRRLKKPLILAGGLNAGNVAQAIRIVGPYAVDACSGVEAGPGRKDFEKMRRFVEAAKSVVVANPLDF
jgi:phosphoribosylanthranilate isomerase